MSQMPGIFAACPFRLCRKTMPLCHLINSIRLCVRRQSAMVRIYLHFELANKEKEADRMHSVLAHGDVFERPIKCKSLIVCTIHFIRIDMRCSTRRLQHIAAAYSSLLCRQLWTWEFVFCCHNGIRRTRNKSCDRMRLDHSGACAQCSLNPVHVVFSRF